MHRGHIDRPRYTGSGPHPLTPHGHMMAAPHHHHHPAAYQGFCHSCCHPRSKCCCGCRECRKEAKELLVQPTISQEDIRKDPNAVAAFSRITMAAPIVAKMEQPGEKKSKTADIKSERRLASEEPLSAAMAAVTQKEVKLGVGEAFIGGGCCVHLSIEYTPSSPTVVSIVVVMVEDSEGTIMAWAKTEQPGAGYQIKECIITTKPGAELRVAVANMTARVRWCEVFSC